jgi:hypothetical protein
MVVPCFGEGPGMGNWLLKHVKNLCFRKKRERLKPPDTRPAESWNLLSQA